MARSPRSQPAEPDEDTAAPAAAQSVDPVPDATPEIPLPSRVRLLRPYGFTEADGRKRHWHPGTVVADPGEVAALVERKAPVLHLED